MATGFMAGKRGLIMGLANDKSIAWGIARAIAGQGAEIAFSYQGEALKKRVEPLIGSIGMTEMIECDVSDEASLDRLFAHLGKIWGKLDFVVHAIGFSDKNELRGRYVDTGLANFRMTMDISVYSFTAVCRRAAAIMPDGGSLLTLTYFGAERVMPHYNVMGVAKAALEASVRYIAEDLGKDGIRCNAISAGPIKTLAASGIGDFRYILKWNELNSPLRRNIDQDEVGKSALYLLSDLGSGVTGEVHHVDGGYHIVGMKAVDAPDIDVVSGRAERANGNGGGGSGGGGGATEASQKEAAQ
ncbi:MAG: enoyl-[acyl-carrier-protein] reductase FabI [Alphaproteobacteria bacterium HGW-Alphaproteobacteria-6]|nr:MAG: enoyl-[acyl-carrier-protein] reductase FabI [Alphaproteobacteria bacterium HGW-Alphaproteobacteria-6]